MGWVKSLFAVTAAALLTSCGSSAPAPTPPSEATPAQALSDVVDAPLTDVDPTVASLSSSRLITFTSRYAVKDSPKRVTASIFVPKGASPAGGFPVVALGRRIVGTGEGCSAAMANKADVWPTVEALLRLSYLVVVPDYVGFGPTTHDDGSSDGSFHPFLDSGTVAENTIDAVRATRKLVQVASTSWVALGVGQGGQAAWAANEMADSYGWGLELRGTASVAPTADIQGLADAAATGTLSTEQKLAYVAYLDALAKEYPEAFRMDDYRRGAATANWDLLLSCRGNQNAERVSVAEQMDPDDLRPATPQALATLQGYIKKTNLPQGPLKAPMLVLFGAQDPLVPADWTERALDRACWMGDVIAIQKVSDDVSAGLDPSVALPWIADRFANEAPPDDCPEVVSSHPPPPNAGAVDVAPQSGQPNGPAENGVQQPTHPDLDAQQNDVDSRGWDASLISGWLPLAVQVAAVVAVLAAAGWRSRRWRVLWVPVSASVGLVAAAIAYWYVGYQGWGDDNPPTSMWIWIAVVGSAIAVAIIGWPSAPWWRRLVSIAAVPLAVSGTAVDLNASLGYLPTVKTAWQTVTGNEPADWVNEETLAAMVRQGSRPTHGTIVTVRTPSDHSGFAHRDELVYLPPAWFSSSPPPPLPAVMIIGGEMGGPAAWINAGHAVTIFDEFARKHRGVTPVFVFPDVAGTFANDTECVNGPRGNAADHLTEEVVPYVATRFGVSRAPANWGVLGWSTGGTCALTLTVMHPQLFSTFVALDGELGPETGSKEQTIARLFGGDADAWTAFDPKSVVQAHGQYRGVSAWLGVGEETPTMYRPGLTAPSSDEAFDDWVTSGGDPAKTASQLCRFLSGYGIECAVSSFSGGHDFASAAKGLEDSLPWLAGAIGTPGVQAQTLPGAPRGN